MHTSPADSPVWDDGRLADPHGQPDKAARVRAMFDEIAPTYERVNRVLSAGRDAYWRRHAVQMAVIQLDDRVLDLACGTGDFARAFAVAKPKVVIGCDFAEQMLRQAADRRIEDIRWCMGDALTLPFADASFTVASCAFGVRNWQSLDRGLTEVFRVLRKGGRFVILEFSMPRAPLVARAYQLYFRRILPTVATWISGDRTGAYRYLPASVTAFIDEAGMTASLRAAGFARVEARRLTLGIVTVFVAWKD
ncbi:MAG TPA: bifunctional demethylmenaquinone methyltransferase/2-methoxy-6-polyprenyl-1,4-benzoquinol methylase UbiE [Phycisphaerae bacterium]|nr:bifunctional demethylmenaquinone methyltransferase/2-methoxy-6-polyprenyl-1,4-benzoquinol methylase UbiE [Phycisphaerae bacterium]